MSIENILKKVLIKLAKNKLSEKEVEDIIFKTYIDRYEAVKDNYSKKIKLDDEKHDQLRDIYLNGDVKKLYTYATRKFGFEFMGFRFDVTLGYLDIKKLED